MTVRINESLTIGDSETVLVLAADPAAARAWVDKVGLRPAQCWLAPSAMGVTGLVVSHVIVLDSVVEALDGEAAIAAAEATADQVPGAPRPLRLPD